jgi:hypothetical protein
VRNNRAEFLRATGRIADESLGNWAALLLMIDLYDFEGDDEERIVEALNEWALFGI